MASVIDTLEVLFTADIAPLSARLSEIGGRLSGLSAMSAQADASLRSLAGALDFGMDSLKSKAHSAGAAVGDSFAKGLRSKRGAVDAAVKYLTGSALAALLKLLGAGGGAGASSGAGQSVSSVAARFDSSTLAGAEPGGQASGSAVQNLTIPIEVDGIRLGEACIRGLQRVSRVTGRGVIGV